MSWQLYLAGFILLEKTSEKFSNFSFFVGHRKHWHWHYPNIGWVKRGGGKGWFRIGFLFCIVQRYTCKSKEEDLIKIWDFVKLGIIISTCLESLKIVHKFLTSWVPLNVHFSSTVALILSGLTKLVWTGIQIRDPNPYPDKTRLLTKP